MDAKDFGVRLKKIKAEILALKQAHKYGVAQTNFPVYLVDLPFDGTNTNDIKVEATFNSGDLPFTRVLGPNIYKPTITWENGKLTYISAYFDLAQARFIFSTPASSFTYEEIEPNE